MESQRGRGPRGVVTALTWRNLAWIERSGSEGCIEYLAFYLWYLIFRYPLFLIICDISEFTPRHSKTLTKDGLGFGNPTFLTGVLSS